MSARPQGAVGVSLGEDSAVRRNAFVQSVFLRHHEALFRFLRAKLGNETEASDVAQDTYVRLCRQRDLEKVRGRERSYLFTIATNLLKDRRRRWRSAKETIPFEEVIRCEAADQETPLSRLEDKLLTTQVKKALLQMDLASRQVFLLRRTQAMTYRDIAKQLGVSERTVERRMQKALKHLLQALRKPACRAEGDG